MEVEQELLIWYLPPIIICHQAFQPQHCGLANVNSDEDGVRVYVIKSSSQFVWGPNICSVGTSAICHDSSVFSD